MTQDELLSDKKEPELSIVVAIIAGGRSAMETCLSALESGIGGHEVQCIVPFDSRLTQVDELKQRFEWVDFLDAREFVDYEKFGETSREHHDILRAIGLRLATAPIVALLEDHGTPSENWCRSVIEVHEDLDVAGFGGAVGNGVDRILNWAVYYCDFGRYQSPVPEGDVEFLSDSNVSYKREALMSVKPLWYEAFHETSVNWELVRTGYKLRLDPRLLVYQTRKGLRFLPALRERFVWGRSFAGTRASEISNAKRLVFAGLSCLLPIILTARIFSRAITKKSRIKELFLALPYIFLLQIFWAFGEFVGYITRRAAPLAAEHRIVSDKS